jgi:hypothetical protein
MLTGDFTGVFYTEVSPEAESTLQVAEVTISAEALETEMAIPHEKEAAPEEAVPASPAATPLLSKEDTTEEVINIPEAQQEPEPSAAPVEDRGIARMATGAGEVLPPTPPPHAPSAEETEASQKAAVVPGTAEATSPTPNLREKELPLKEAYPWLRPLEIAFATLVVILGGTNILVRQRKWGLTTMKRN